MQKTEKAPRFLPPAVEEAGENHPAAADNGEKFTAPAVVEEDESSGSSTSGSEDSGTDSEGERQRREERRKRREQIIAEKAAVAAAKSIKDREDVVARLEGEKKSLEMMLEEREKQAAQEVMPSLHLLHYSLILCPHPVDIIVMNQTTAHAFP